MEDFTQEQTQMLMAGGFHAAWMKELQQGDEVAIGGCAYPVHELRQYVVASLEPDIVGDHDERGYVRSTRELVRFIGIDLDGLPHHETFGGTYPCFIKTPESETV